MTVHEVRMGRPADLDLTMPAAPGSVTIARQALSGVADATGWDADFVADVKIALSEACSNVVVHAYPDGEAGPLRVRMWVDAGELLIIVSDEGAGISPSLGKQAGLGLGLPLMAALSDEVQMRSATDGSTEVQMRFSPLRERQVAG